MKKKCLKKWLFWDGLVLEAAFLVDYADWLYIFWPGFDLNLDLIRCLYSHLSSHTLQEPAHSLP